MIETRRFGRRAAGGPQLQITVVRGMTESVPILMYHAVAEHPPAATRRPSVTPRSLEEQLAFLADHGFTGLTFSDLADAVRTGGILPKRPGGSHS